MTESITSDYKQEGFVLIRNAIPQSVLDTLEDNFLGLVSEWGGEKFESVSEPEFAKFLAGNRDLERKLYDGIREFPWLVDVSVDSSIVGPVKTVVGEDIGLLGKVVFRIDLPMVMRELAVWHQDHYYVRGNTDTVTAWIPLQKTTYPVGCLMVMPGSHKKGVLDHDLPLLGKKFVPSNIFNEPFRYVEMDRGDLLLFNSLLLHSSGMNISDRTRCSIQARYSPMSKPTDPSMGKLIPLQ